MRFEDSVFCRIVYTTDVYDIKTSESDWNFSVIHDNKTYYNGYLIHREDGPAMVWDDGDKSWWINGKKYSEDEYWSIINTMKKKEILESIL